MRAQLPFAGGALLHFLAQRAIAGVEHVDSSAYARVFSRGAARGTVHVELAPDGTGVTLHVEPALLPWQQEIAARVRHLFDLDAPSAQIDARLAGVPALASSVRTRPGLRLPGAFDVWEMGVRAVLGQQVSVKGARTLAGRLVEQFGTPLPNTEAGAALRSQFPSAQRVAALEPDAVRSIGIPLSRARTLVALAQRLANDELLLTPGADVEVAMRALQTLPGIGPWTAAYIAMRALKGADVFLAGDLGAKKALGVKSEREAERAAERFRPYRAYALMHLWASLH